VRASRRWLDRAGIVEGPVFCRVRRGGMVDKTQALTSQSLAGIVKRHCAQAGLDPKLYGAHSLRAGWCTTFAQTGASDSQGMEQSGHASHASWKRYVRKASVMRDNAT
jgi:site-specific recombinase XerD